MTVAINPVQNDSAGRNMQMLGLALDAATKVYGVQMTDKQKAVADKMAQDKTAQEMQQKKDELASKNSEHQKDFIAVGDDYKGPGASAITFPGESQGVMRVPTTVYNKYLESQTELQKARIAAEAKNKDDQKNITSAQMAKIGDLQGVNNMLDSISDDWDKLAAKPLSSVTQFAKTSDANKYNEMVKARALGLASALEGKGASPAMAQVYEGLLPNPWDTAALKKAKIDSLRQVATQKLQGRLSGFESTGYNVGDLGNNNHQSQAQDNPANKVNSLLQNDPDFSKAMQELQKRGLTGTAQNQR